MKVIKTHQYKIAQSTITLPETNTFYIPEESEEDIFETEYAEEQEPQDLPEIGIEDIPIEDDTQDIETIEEAEEPIFDNIKEPENMPEFTSTFQAMRYAKHENEVVTIQYVTDGGISITRTIEPHGDFFARTTHNRILVTYDETVGGIRAFIINNIQDFRFNGQKFEPKFNFSRERRNFTRRLRRKRDKIKN